MGKFSIISICFSFLFLLLFDFIHILCFDEFYILVKFSGVGVWVSRGVLQVLYEPSKFAKKAS